MSPPPASLILTALALCLGIVVGHQIGSKSTQNRLSKDGHDTHALMTGSGGLLSPGAARSREAGDPSERNAAIAVLTEPSWTTATGSDLGTVAEMRAAASGVFASLDPLARDLQFPLLIARLTPDNASGLWQALRSAEGNDLPGISSYARVLADAWARIDGPTALDAIQRTSGGGGEGSSLCRAMGTAALEGWSRTSPTTALEWARDQARSVDQSMATGLIRGLASTSPELAASYAIEHAGDGGSISEAHARVLVAACDADGIERTLEWTETLEHKGLQEKVMTSLASRLTREDPELARSWLARQATLPESVEAIRISAERQLTDAVSANGDGHTVVFEWIDSLPDGAAKEAAYTGAIRKWASKNANGAAQMLAELPATPARDNAVAAFSMQIIHKDPEAAVHWAATISRKEQRERALMPSLRRWMLTAPQAARNWLEEAGIDPASIETELLPIR